VSIVDELNITSNFFNYGRLHLFGVRTFNYTLAMAVQGRIVSIDYLSSPILPFFWAIIFKEPRASRPNTIILRTFEGLADEK
jgi:hypothetical protein